MKVGAGFRLPSRVTAVNLNRRLQALSLRSFRRLSEEAARLTTANARRFYRLPET